MGIRAKAQSYVVRITLVLLVSVTLSIALIAAISYYNLYQTTAENAAIRIDRAARAAAGLLGRTYPEEFVVERDLAGKPAQIFVLNRDPADLLVYTDGYDELLREIGKTNEGAANLFRWNSTTGAFDRIVTTFRTPTGDIPPPMSISSGHPAYADLSKGRAFSGEVPVMGRMRLAYLTPILTKNGQIAGALAVDVGWADDLLVARADVQQQIFGASAIILLLIAALGAMIMHSATRPLRNMAAFAEAVARGERKGDVPYQDRKDEVGDLAHGLAKVVELQERLETIAYTDPIAEVGNRAKYLADLKRAVDRASWEPFLLCHLDFEGFSKVNEAFGATAGDAVLHQTGLRLKRELDGKGQVYRVSGDDFALILPQPASGQLQPVEQFARRTLGVVSAPFLLPEGEVHAVPNLGIARIPHDAVEVDTANRRAALALRAARKTIRSSFTFFSEQLSAESEREVAMEAALREAINLDGLEVFYQPQICLRRMRLKGFEALARWPDGKGGYIPPSAFIPVAEKTGLIIDLGAWVLDSSCRQAREWIDARLPFDYIAVNVSPIQIWQPNFEQIVQASLERHNLPASHLCLEVTENVFIGHDESRMMEVLKKLRALGVVLSLDDFGTGYSSLSYLNRLPFSQLKIDRAFVAGAHLDASKEKLLRGMVNLGQTLGLKVIAEGTEEAPEIELTRRINCDGVQGFYFSKPLPAAEAQNILPQLLERTSRFEPKVAAAAQ